MTKVYCRQCGCTNNIKLFMEKEIETLKAENETLRKSYEAWKSHDLILQSKYNKLLSELAATKKSESNDSDAALDK